MVLTSVSSGGSLDGGVIQFGNSGIPISQYAVGLKEAEDVKGTTVTDSNGNITVNPDQQGDFTKLASVLSGVNGAAMGGRNGGLDRAG